MQDVNSTLNDSSFWDSNADYQKLAHKFTSRYAEQAWAASALGPGARVLDIAAGAGALSLIAARAGAQVLATDFSQGMVDAALSHGLPNLQGRVMDGQALDLADGSFDAAFSMFGIMLFPNWRKGLAEMARVIRPGGLGVIGTWKLPAGAAANLLLSEHIARLFPDFVMADTIDGMRELRDPARFENAMKAAGFGAFTLVQVTNDFIIDRVIFSDPEALFRFSEVWPLLDAGQRKALIASMRDAIEDANGAIAVASPALIGLGRRI